MKLSKLSTTGTTTKITVSDELFGVVGFEKLLAQAVRVYRANKRQGTSKTQRRSEVSRTKAKLYRQKGTGNARHGSRNAPIFVGGGVAHGPSGEQNWLLQLPKQLKKKSLATALSLQASAAVVLESLKDFTTDATKTKQAAKLIASVAQANDRVLVIIPQATQENMRSLYNVSQVKVVFAEFVTALEILSADKLALHPDTIAILEKRVVA